MEINEIEVVIFCISVALSVICMIVGIVRGLHSAKVLGGGVMTMVVTWLIFISILMLFYNLICFLGLVIESDVLQYIANIILFMVPIFALRIIWGFADYVKELEKFSQ